MSVDELLCLLRKAMRGDQLILVATAAEHIHVVAFGSPQVDQS
jgi:hypothetical protein